MADTNKNKTTKLLTLKELMEKANIKSRTSVYNQIKNGMPVIYITDEPLFDWDEVLEWGKSRKFGRNRAI